MLARRSSILSGAFAVLVVLIFSLLLRVCFLLKLLRALLLHLSSFWFASRTITKSTTTLGARLVQLVLLIVEFLRLSIAARLIG